jgi:hypothetical protein
VFWKALPEHNPRKLDSFQNSYYTTNDNLSKTNYKISHNNSYCKYTGPKIAKPVGSARYHIKALLKTRTIPTQPIELKICIRV